MGLRPGSKQTEVGVIPEDWCVVKASDACSKIQDGTHFSPRDSGNDFLYVTSKNIRFGYLDLTTASRIDSAQHQSIYRRCDVKKGDLLLTKDGANTGNAALNTLEEEFSLLSSVAFLRFHGDRHSASFFLQQILTSQGQRQIQDAMAGNAITRLTLEKINRLTFSAPSTLSEQEAIAEALSDADVLIKSLEQLLAKKRHLKQGAMQELLTGKRRLSGFETKPGYRWTEIGEIPNDWDVRRLGEGIKLISGQHVLAQHCNMDGHGVAYITGPADFPDGCIRHTKWTTRPGTICNAGDILITVKGSGSGALVLSSADYCISRQLMAVRVLQWCPSYVFYYLLRDVSLFETAATGLIPGLARGDLLNKLVPIPPMRAEQEAIAIVFEDEDTEIAALESKLIKAHQIKQGMMQELLTGRIRLV